MQTASIQRNPKLLWNHHLAAEFEQTGASPESMYIQLDGRAFLLQDVETAVWMLLRESCPVKAITDTILSSGCFSKYQDEALKEIIYSSIEQMLGANLLLAGNDCQTDSAANSVNKSLKRIVARTPHLMTVSWNWTNACNFNCSHCYSRTESYDDEISLDQSKEIASQLKKIGVFNIHFGGGECLVRGEFTELLEYCRDIGLQYEVSTNGFTLTENQASRLHELGVSRVNVSIDGPDAETHEQIRGVPSSFEKALNAVKACKTTGLKVAILCSLTIPILDRLDKMLALAELLQVDELIFKVIKRAGNAIENVQLLPSNKALREAFRTLDKISIGKNVNVDFGKYSTPLAMLALAEAGETESANNIENGKAFCSCGRTSLCVKPDGMVTPCSYVMASLGALPQDDLWRIWAGDNTLKQIRGLTEPEFDQNCQTNIEKIEPTELALSSSRA